MKTGYKILVLLLVFSLHLCLFAEVDEEAVVYEIVETILKSVDRPDFRISLNILDSEIPEAFAHIDCQVAVIFGIYNFLLPVYNYSLVISKGMIDLCKTNEGELDKDMLAGVLAHEIAHILLGHIEKEISLSDMSLGQRSKQRKELELEADKYALFYIANAGYRISGFRELLNKLSLKTGILTQSKYIITHPSTPERIAFLQTLETEIKTLSELFTKGSKEISKFKLDKEQIQIIDSYIKILNNLLNYFPKSPQVYNNLALCYYYKYLISGSKFPDMLIRTVPEVDFEVKRGVKLLLRGPMKPDKSLLEESRKHFLKALQLNPDYKNAMINLSVVELELENYENLSKLCSNIMTIDPNSLDGKNILGIVYYKTNKKVEAKKQFSKIIQHNKHYGPAYYNLFSIYINEKNLKKANELLDTYRNIIGEDVYYVNMQETLKNVKK